MLISQKGAIGILYLGLIALLLFGLVLFPQLADMRMYSWKINVMKDAFKTAILAAAQEISVEDSREGIAFGFDENTGVLQTEGIYFDRERSKKVFEKMLAGSTGMEKSKFDDNLLFAMLEPDGDNLYFTCQRGNSETVTKVLSTPEEVEEEINRQLNFGEVDSRYVIFVNGNIRTNDFVRRPYLIAVIKDVQIDGLFSGRRYTFVGFQSGRVNRRRG